MTGYAPDEAIGRTPHILQGPKTDPSLPGRLCKDCAAGKVFHGETINYRKDRSEIYLEWTAGPVRDERGEVTHFAAALLDVTERRRIEEERRRGEEEFRSLFELSAIGMAQVSPEGRYLRVNRKFCQMLGYSEQELLRLTLHEVTHPEDREFSAAKLESSFADGSEEFSIENRYVRKDGGIIRVLINWTVVRDADGRPLRTVANIQDITERKQIEEALQTSEAQLRDILDHSVALIFVKDLEGRYLRVNRRYEESFGVADAELRGKTDYDHHPKEIADAFVANDREVIAADRPILFEEQAFVAGETRYSVVSKFPLRDWSGRPYAICGIATDITERKRAETALLESQALNQAVLDSLAANIAVLDRGGNIIAVNEHWKRFARENGGATIADSVGVNYLDVYRRSQEQVNGQIEATLKGIQEVLDGARPNFTVEYPCHSPVEKRWFLMSVTPLLGEGGGAVVAHTDITQRKQVEESLRVSEARLDLALNAGAIGTFDWDIRANKAIWTEQLKALFGLPPGGSAETYETWLERVFPEDRPACEAGLREILGKKLRRWRTEYRIVRADTGEVRWIGSKGRVFYDEQGEPLRFIGTNMDITERKRAEAEREELLVREQAAREAAEALTRAKDEILAVVSHELRSPLTAMLGYAVLLRHGGLDAQKVRHAAEVIERSGKAQLQLIDDLLDTARIISGKLRLELGPVDLVSVIEQAVQTIRPAADAKGISIETDFPSEIGQITGDPFRLQQVVWNLLSNAVKFTEQGGRVGVRLERIDPHICITVSDTGRGIRPDILPYVFDRFRQADASSARRYGGLGLGLALVKYLVELHGGTIRAASAGEGQGATFDVVLPVRAVATPIEEAEGASTTVKSSGELAGVRALVVDDEDVARELIKMALTQYGADVIAVSSAAEAYAMITAPPPQERPDVIVTDVGMPGEDGYSLIRRVREWARERGVFIPAVALTAYGRVEDRMRALQAGFQMHVAKPV
jgi:PAS domain S-box-containing protein